MSSPQPEQNIMYFIAENADQVLDLSAALTAANRKQYHQTKNLKPLLYHWRAQAIDLGTNTPPIVFAGAQNNWTTRNAVISLGRQYRKQLSDNGIKIKQLPTYGREMRLGLQTSYGYEHASGADGFSATATLEDNTSVAGKVYVPEDYSGSALFSSYTNTDGTAVTYYNSNALTLISVPEMTADGEPEAVVVSLTGTTNQDNNDMALIPEFLASRRNRHDHTELDADFPSDDSILMRIGAAAGEHYDDVVDAVEETGSTRPYDEAGCNKLVTQGALMNKGDYCSGVAPLGLLHVDSAADCKFLLTVTAITEM